MNSSDPLSIAGIARRQQEIEVELQTLPSQQQEADYQVVMLEGVWLKAKAFAYSAISGEGKLLAAERDLRVHARTEREWTEYQVAVVAADYLRGRSRALYSELISLASRLKAAMQADGAHQGFGGG